MLKYDLMGNNGLPTDTTLSMEGNITPGNSGNLSINSNNGMPAAGVPMNDLTLKTGIPSATPFATSYINGNKDVNTPVSAINPAVSTAPTPFSASFAVPSASPAAGIAQRTMPPTKVITSDKVRWSYVNVWAPKSVGGGTPKYSVSLIISKTDTETLNAIQAAIQAAYQEGAAKLKGAGQTVPPLSAIRTPLRDGDAERPGDPAYANSYFINANSPTAPGIVDANCNPVIERSEIYSGVFGRASISFYAYNRSGNRGIACSLNNLQKIRNGEPLGGKPKASSDFAAFSQPSSSAFDFLG